MNDTLIIEDNAVYEIDPNCKLITRNGRRKAVLLKATETHRKQQVLLAILLTFTL